MDSSDAKGVRSVVAPSRNMAPCGPCRRSRKRCHGGMPCFRCKAKKMSRDCIPGATTGEMGVPTYAHPYEGLPLPLALSHPNTSLQPTGSGAVSQASANLPMMDLGIHHPSINMEPSIYHQPFMMGDQHHTNDTIGTQVGYTSPTSVARSQSSTSNRSSLLSPTTSQSPVYSNHGASGSSSAFSQSTGSESNPHGTLPTLVNTGSNFDGFNPQSFDYFPPIAVDSFTRRVRVGPSSNNAGAAFSATNCDVDILSRFQWKDEDISAAKIQELNAFYEQHEAELSSSN